MYYSYLYYTYFSTYKHILDYETTQTQKTQNFFKKKFSKYSCLCIWTNLSLLMFSFHLKHCQKLIPDQTIREQDHLKIDAVITEENVKTQNEGEIAKRCAEINDSQRHIQKPKTSHSSSPM